MIGLQICAIKQHNLLIDYITIFSLDPDLRHFDLEIEGRSGCEQSQLLTVVLECNLQIENLLRSLLGSKILGVLDI